MLIDIVLLACAAVLAGGAYFFKRHAGTLLLIAMAAGLLSVLATQGVTSWLAAHGFALTVMPTDGAVSVGLVLVPAVIGWFVAPKSHAKLRRLVGALLFGAVTATLVAGHAETIFDSGLLAQSHSVAFLQQYQGYIVTVGVMYALLDLLLGKGRPPKEEGKK